MTIRMARSSRKLGAALIAIATGCAACHAESGTANPPQAIPASEEVPLDLTEAASPEIRAASARLYDYVRLRMKAVEISEPIAADVLASITKQGRRDFAYPATHYSAWYSHRPSVLNLLCWRRDLLQIAADTERRFAHSASTPVLSAPDGDIVPYPPDPGNRLSTRLPGALREALGGLGDLGAECSEARPALLTGPFKWASAVRIESTGRPDTDARIAAALVRIKRSVPHAPIDAASFPAPAGTGNLFFGPPGSQAFAFSFDTALNRCLEMSRCIDLGQFLGAGSADSPLALRASTRSFLSASYFSRPYHINFGRPMAIVNVTSEGKIIGAACGYEDRDADDEREQTNVTSCLAQALGAYPTDERDANGYEPDYESALIEAEIAELNSLY